VSGPRAPICSAAPTRSPEDIRAWPAAPPPTSRCRSATDPALDQRSRAVIPPGSKAKQDRRARGPGEHSGDPRARWASASTDEVGGRGRLRLKEFPAPSINVYLRRRADRRRPPLGPAAYFRRAGGPRDLDARPDSPLTRYQGVARTSARHVASHSPAMQTTSRRWKARRFICTSIELRGETPTMYNIQTVRARASRIINEVVVRAGSRSIIISLL